MKFNRSHLRPLAALHVVLVSLVLAALACTSRDTLFIQLTVTPTPTITPTPLSQNTKFQIKDKVYLVSAVIVVDLAEKPAPLGSGVFGSGTCSPNQQITVLDISKNTSDPKDPVLYYNVECSGSGWVPEYVLTHLRQYGTATVKTKEGKGTPLYTDPDTKSKLASDAGCAEGTKVKVQNLTLNPDTAVLRGGDQTTQPDYNIYVQVTCGEATGYVIEKDLVPES